VKELKKTVSKANDHLSKDLNMLDQEERKQLDTDDKRDEAETAS